MQHLINFPNSSEYSDIIMPIDYFDSEADRAKYACTYFSEERRRYLLHLNDKVNKIKYNEQTLLYIAVILKDTMIAKFLLDSGVSSNFKVKKEWTPLHLACKTGNEPLVDILLSHGAKINVGCGNPKNTPLYIATNLNYEGIVELLLKHGANINAQNELGLSSLHAACSRGNLYLVKLLLSYGANINHFSKFSLTPIFAASVAGHAEVVDFLLKRGADYSVKYCSGWAPIHSACSIGNEKIVELILDKGADIHMTTSRNESPLYIASRFGKINVIKFLLQRGANPNDQDMNGVSAIFAATETKSKHVVKLLLKYGADPTLKNKGGFNSLHAACACNHGGQVIFLINIGVDINSPSNDNTTPIQTACQFGYDKIVDVLLKLGANPNSKDSHGWTPLHTAVSQNCPKIVFNLLLFGAEVDTIDIHGRTALCTAVSRQLPDCVHILLLNGANINFLPYTEVQDSKNIINQLLIREVIKFKIANMYFGQIVIPNDNFKDFEYECQAEVLNMKSRLIPNSCVSVYGFLTKNIPQLAQLFNNEEIIQSGLHDCESKYPIYFNNIHGNFQKGYIRCELHNKTFRYIHRLFDLPDLCVHKIITYLSSDDMKNIIAAYPEIDAKTTT